MASWIVRTPSRLHFGLVAICSEEPHRYGGLGMMIDEPSFEIKVHSAAHWNTTACGSWGERIDKGARHWQSFHGMDALPGLQWEILQAPEAHCGFGSGTQLACAVATILQSHKMLGYGHADSDQIDVSLRKGVQQARNVWMNPASVDGEGECSVANRELQRASGRGERSHIGMAGFLSGGWIWDEGMQSESQETANAKTRIRRVSVPSEWRILLIDPLEKGTISGQREADFFQRCADAPNPHRQAMLDLVETILLPCAMQGNLAAMGDALFDYGRMSGKIFRQVQGGPFRTRALEERVMRLRSLGASASGQSSWGPTLFGIVENQEIAERIASQWRSESADRIRIVAPQCTGATLELR